VSVSERADSGSSTSRSMHGASAAEISIGKGITVGSACSQVPA